MKITVAEIITNKIIEKLEQGVIPWHKPWSTGGRPSNLTSKALYRGINVLLLSMQGYASPCWVTFKQAQELGGNIKTGEKGTPVIFWNVQSKKVLNRSGDVEERKIPFMRYYTVFNLAQTEGIETPEDPDAKPFLPILSCEEIVKNMPGIPVIEHGRAKASYGRSADVVYMPPPESFKSDVTYYSVLFHELVHSTGHAKRLGRKGIVNQPEFGSDDYMNEELVAEIGAGFLSSYAGIADETLDDSAAYISLWLARLKANKNLIITSAQKAQRAVDFILNRDAVETKAA
jgi:antirestriction protein ArdC